MIQVAKKASVLKRKKSRNRMDVESQQNVSGEAGAGSSGAQESSRSEPEADIIYYVEEPKASTPNRVRKDNR